MFRARRVPSKRPCWCLSVAKKEIFHIPEAFPPFSGPGLFVRLTVTLYFSKVRGPTFVQDYDY
jgi:hypothetical protein